MAFLYWSKLMFDFMYPNNFCSELLFWKSRILFDFVDEINRKHLLI